MLYIQSRRALPVSVSLGGVIVAPHAFRGHQTCRLRVVRSNAVAVQFYLSHEWQIAREFAHEKYHHPMLELAKSLPGSPSSAP
jgi:hypothetical protein